MSAAKKRGGEAVEIQTYALIILAVCALLAVLIYGAGFLVPLVIAVLLTSLIAAAISRLEALGLPKWMAGVCAIGVVFLANIFVAVIMYEQAAAMSLAWPKYAARFSALASEFELKAGPDIAVWVKETLAGIDFGGHISGIAGSAGSLFTNVGLIFMYCAFLLAERGFVSSKFANLVSDPAQKKEYEQKFETIARGVRRYLWVKTLTSLTTATLCYVILKYFSVDFAEFWGILIFFLNFIPNIGSAFAVFFPSMLALVQFETVLPFVQVVVLMTAVQFVVGNIVEPKYMGKSLNLSPFVVLLSLTFWGTIWGIAGMFLSVPIAASLVIICRDIPALRWLAVLMSEGGDPDASEKPEDQSKAGKARAFKFSWQSQKSKARTQEIEDLKKQLEQAHKDRL